MRTLYITRHANTLPATGRMRDFNRQLSERGLQDAPMMAQRFAQRNEPLDLMMASTAARTQATAQAFSAALNKLPIESAPSLYAATLETLMAIIAGFPNAVRSAMIVGHNPGVSLLVDHLSGGMGTHLIPCTTVRIDLHVESWREVARGIGTEVWRDAPPVR